jgi:hypothetical protein
VKIDVRRLRPAEVLALTAGLLLAVALFLPWYDFPAGREDAWRALPVTAIPAALAALSALALVAMTLAQRSASLPLVVAIASTLLGLLSSVVIALRATSLPMAATARCYGLWLGLAGSLAVLVAAWLSLRDERPFWGVPAAR